MDELYLNIQITLNLKYAKCFCDMIVLLSESADESKL